MCVFICAGCVTNKTNSGISSPQSSIKEAPAEMPQKVPTYRINVGDVLEVFVWRSKGLDDPREVIVRPDGVVSYPLVGDVRAVGLTLTEFDHQLTEELKKFIRHPEVSVAIKRFGGMKVIVLGEVAREGVYAPTTGARILEAIALAGGFKPTAVRRSTILIRGGMNNPKPVRLNLARALARGSIDQNVILMPNDIIYVPQKFSATFNYYMDVLTPTLRNLLYGTQAARDLGFLPWYGDGR